MGVNDNFDYFNNSNENSQDTNNNPWELEWDKSGWDTGFGNDSKKYQEWSVDSFLEDNNLSILELDIEEIIYNLNNLSLEQRKEFLQHEKIKNCLKQSIIKKGNNYQFWQNIFKNIIYEEIEAIFDKEFIKNLLEKNDNTLPFLFQNIDVESSSKLIAVILNNDDLFNLFKFLYEKMMSCIKINNDVFVKLIQKIEQTDSYTLFNSFKYTNDNMKYAIGENFSLKTIIWLLDKMPRELASDFFQNDPRAISVIPYLKDDIDNYLYKGVLFGEKIIKNPNFFEILKSKSMIKFRERVAILENLCDDPHYIENKAKEYDNELIYKYKNEANQTYRTKEMNLNISEVIVDALFEDNIYNVWINIKELLNYNSCLSDEEKVVSKENVEFYKIILDFDKISVDRKIEIYEKLKGKNINLMFYNDMRKTKDLAYKKVKENMINISQHPEYKNKEETEKNGVKVYDLRDKEYYMLVRAITGYEHGKSNKNSGYTLISDKNTHVFFDDGCLFAYNTFDIDKVEHMSFVDSHSERVKEGKWLEIEGQSYYPNKIATANEIANFGGYSEIILKNSPNDEEYFFEMKPDYVVAIDEITNKDVSISKRLGIPIVIIKSNEKTNLISSHVENIEKYTKAGYEIERRNTRK